MCGASTAPQLPGGELSHAFEVVGGNSIATTAEARAAGNAARARPWLQVARSPARY